MENRCADSYHQARKAYSRCALITLAASLLMQGLGLALNGSPYVLRLNASDPSAALLITQLPLPLVLIPAYFLLRPKERWETGGEAVTPGEFMTLLLAALPVMYGGTLIGNLLASLLSMGGAVNRLTALGEQMTVPLALYVVLAGPLAEELFFRGMILPRLTRYGQKTALFFSALLFALYHVNVYQFFYAFGLGLLLGAAALKTGGVRTGFLLHAAINLLGGVVPYVILNLSAGAMISFALVMLTLAGFGVASLLRFRREMVFLPAPQELPADIGRRAALLNAGFILLLAASLALSLIDLFMWIINPLLHD